MQEGNGHTGDNSLSFSGSDRSAALLISENKIRDFQQFVWAALAADPVTNSKSYFQDK